MVAKDTERLAVSKEAAQKFEGERFNLWKLNELEVRKHYQIKVSNKFAALEKLNESQHIERVREIVKENVRTLATGLYDLKQPNPRLKEECLGFMDQSKQAKMQ